MFTTQRQIRAAFWEAHPALPRRKIRNYAGTGRMYPTDTRVAFVDFIDYLQRDRQISDALARRVTLGGDE
jgi:hypothetical protein